MKIIKGELNNSGITKSISLIDNCGNDITSVMSSLDSFINDTKLNSEAYDKIRSLISSYKNLLLIDRQIASDLSQAINSTTANMSNFMGEFDEIDDSKKDEINNSIIALRNSIADYDNQVRELSATGVDNDEIGVINQNKANALANLEHYNKLMEKISALASYDNGQYSQLTGISSNLASLKTNFENIA